MAPKSKSLFRQPGAQHFQLVHRSQRDPQIYNPDASNHVLKPVIRENAKKGKARVTFEAPEEDNSEDAVGQAALYGIYYDDSEYDYMQHLRPVGVQEDGVESVLVEAPSSIKREQKPTSKLARGISLKDLPQEALPSTSELPRNYESQQAIPTSIAGFQPDMDPHLRQALEALEDDAFVDDDLNDDFFGDLVQEGERESDEEFDFEFHEYGPDGANKPIDATTEDGSWEQQFAQFKLEQRNAPRSDDEDGDFQTEGGDTVPGLPTISVIGGKKRRKGTSDASGYSMSSSSMVRNEALQTLDQRFDQVMLKQYDDMPDDEEVSEDDDAAPELAPSRADFSSMVDEFLNDFEILGRKLKPRLEGETGVEKLDTLRRAMGQDARVKGSLEQSDGDDSPSDDEEDDKKDRWDCETILTTYSNLENHPRLIRARDTQKVPKIRLDGKTGLPTTLDDKTTRPTNHWRPPPTDSENTDDSDSEPPRRQAVGRPRNETAEDKKERKAAVKAERASRRVEKKATKEVFGSEFKKQSRQRLEKDVEVRTRKL